MIQAATRHGITGIAPHTVAHVLAEVGRDGTGETVCFSQKRLNQANLWKLDESYRKTNESLMDCPCVLWKMTLPPQAAGKGRLVCLFHAPAPRNAPQPAQYDRMQVVVPAQMR